MLGATLSPEELEEFMQEAYLVRIMMMLRIFTCFSLNFFQDGNGKLDYDEFVKMLLQY